MDLTFSQQIFIKYPLHARHWGVQEWARQMRISAFQDLTHYWEEQTINMWVGSRENSLKRWRLSLAYMISLVYEADLAVVYSASPPAPCWQHPSFVQASSEVCLGDSFASPGSVAQGSGQGGLAEVCTITRIKQHSKIRRADSLPATAYLQSHEENKPLSLSHRETDFLLLLPEKHS